MKKAGPLFLGTLLLLVSFSATPLTSWIEGDLGDIHNIVASVISKYFAVCTGAEAKAALDKLGPEKKNALINFLGEPGREFLLSKCQNDVCTVVKTFSPGKSVSEDDFRKIYPDILDSLFANLPMDRYNKFIPSTRDEIGPEGIFLGWQGQGKYFDGLDFARHEVILQNTPTWLFSETGLRRYAELKDYSCIMYKQERLGSKLQDVETIVLKYREHPKSIYMKWVAGPWTGRELLYNESIPGHKKDVRVREKGVLGIIPIWIDYNNPIAQRGSNHPATDIGLKFMLELNLDQYKKATAKNELSRKDHGIQEVDGRKVYVMENILPKEKKKGYYCRRVFQYMDYANGIEPRVDVYNWDEQLMESFTYTKLKLNAGLTEKDFTPSNPEYRL